MSLSKEKTAKLTANGHPCHVTSVQASGSSKAAAPLQADGLGRLSLAG